MINAVREIVIIAGFAFHLYSAMTWLVERALVIPFWYYKGHSNQCSFWHQFKCAGSEEIPAKKIEEKKKRKENKPIQQNAKQTTSRHLHTIDRESRKKNTNNMNTAKKICWKKNGIVIVSTVFKA